MGKCACSAKPRAIQNGQEVQTFRMDKMCVLSQATCNSPNLQRALHARAGTYRLFEVRAARSSKSARSRLPSAAALCWPIACAHRQLGELPCKFCGYDCCRTAARLGGRRFYGADPNYCCGNFPRCAPSNTSSLARRVGTFGFLSESVGFGFSAGTVELLLYYERSLFTAPYRG